jgi:monofunctional biosynthetic peptidoglycan transglycosylase
MNTSDSPILDDSPASPTGELAGANGEQDSQPGATPRGALRRGLLLGWRLLVGLVIALALTSVATVEILRWVDPPASAFMLRHARVAAGLGRPPPHYHHHWVPWEEIPMSVRLAAIAAEDQRFPLHHGFDPVEIRKAWGHHRRGGTLRGASTITQQTAKNLFLWPERSWLRKGLEAWLTAWIELLWPKERILEVYLNIVQLSPSTYGVGAASERYFDRPLAELSLEEASLLAGVLPAPSAYRLDRPSPQLRRRADWIADQARRLGGARYLEQL